MLVFLFSYDINPMEQEQTIVQFLRLNFWEKIITTKRALVLFLARILDSFSMYLDGFLFSFFSKFCFQQIGLLTLFDRFLLLLLLLFKLIKKIKNLKIDWFNGDKIFIYKSINKQKNKKTTKRKISIYIVNKKKNKTNSCYSLVSLTYSI